MGVLFAVALICGLPLVAVMQRRAAVGDPYPPEAADVPDVVEQAYRETDDTFGWQRARLLDEVGSCVCAGSELHRMTGAEARLRLRLMVEADDHLRALRELPYDLDPLYVVPEVER